LLYYCINNVIDSIQFITKTLIYDSEIKEVLVIYIEFYC